MQIHELLNADIGTSQEYVYIEVVTESHSAEVRLKASDFRHEELDEKSDRHEDERHAWVFLVQVCVSHEHLEQAAALLTDAVAYGEGSIIARPDFLASVPPNDAGDLKSLRPFTMPGTDARNAEVALVRHLRGQKKLYAKRNLARLYLGAISEPQSLYNIRGNGQKSLSFISHFWDLGDFGVQEKFFSIAPSLGRSDGTYQTLKRGSRSRKPKRSTTSPAMSTRLMKLEQRLRLR